MKNEELTKSKAEENDGKDKLPGKDTHSSLLTSNSSFITIPGVDIQKGIAMTGGTEAGYRSVLSLFHKDAEDRLPLLQHTPEADALPAFVTKVHALKSASASIGAAQVSALAAELETAGKAGDIAFIGKQLPVFVELLTALVKSIQDTLEPGKPEYQDVPQGGNTVTPLPVPHSQLFEKLAEALKSQNAFVIDHILNELNQTPLDSKIRETLEKISDDVLMTEFNNALKTIEELLDL